MRAEALSAAGARGFQLGTLSWTVIARAVAQDEVGWDGGHGQPSPAAIPAYVAGNVAERVLRPQLLGDARVHAGQVREPRREIRLSTRFPGQPREEVSGSHTGL